jgi:hypothetical protein
MHKCIEYKENCCGDLVYYRFNWKVIPRGHPEFAYITTIVLPYCIDHYNRIIKKKL